MTATERYQRKLASFRVRQARSRKAREIALIPIPWAHVKTKKFREKLRSAYDVMSFFRPISFGADEDYIRAPRIAQLIQVGGLLIKTVKVPFISAPRAHSRLWYPWINSLKASDAEGLRHLELKYSAMKWLQSLGSRHVEPEFEFSGGRADVVSRDMGIVVECGQTDCRRVWGVLSGAERAFVLLPHQEAEGGFCAGYVFTGTSCGRDMAKLYAQFDREQEERAMVAISMKWCGRRSSSPEAVR